MGDPYTKKPSDQGWSCARTDHAIPHWKDLKNGADQSGLLEDLRLSSAVQYDSLLPERRCLAAHPPQTRQDRINLLVGSQFKQAICGPQTKVSYLQEDLGDGEAGHVGGN